MSNCQLKAEFEIAVSAPRYSEPRLYDRTGEIRKWKETLTLNQVLKGLISDAETQVINRRIVRVAFLIELCKDDVTSTKYETRWAERFDLDDPRKASFEECCEVYKKLCVETAQLLTSSSFQREFKLIVPWGKSPHEFPADYAAKASPMHCAANIGIIQHENYPRLLEIRQALMDPTLNPDFELFVAVFDKIRVKSYLTDRALTGGFKTNREKRWEAHPYSPQFAFRNDCLEIELKLIEQLMHFENFPEGTLKYLAAKGLAEEGGTVSRCPVTLDPLDFEIFAEEVMNPTFGRSSYQVGHLNPLKAGEGDEFRHAPANISWITEDGNRIQGHLTLKETRKLLLRISDNYERLIESGEINPP